jgi:acyl-CoA thioester hydrolase
MKIRVYYEDTDAGGIVYHTNFIKYCERARSEQFFAKGLRPLEGDTSGFVVTHIDANFHSPAFLGDMLEVQSRVLIRKRSYIVLQQSVYRGSILLFEMDIKLAYISNAKPSKIPDSFVELLDEI